MRTFFKLSWGVLWCSMVLLGPSFAQAQGVNSLKPAPTPTDATETKQELNKSDKAAPTTTTPASKPTQPVSEPKTVPSSEGVKKEPTSSVAQQVAPSALSKKLDNKLLLSTGLHLTHITSAKKGVYRASSAADIALYWLIKDFKTWQLLTSFRYIPIQSENQIDGQSYRGVNEGYMLGSLYRKHLSQYPVDLLAGLELGYLLVYQESVDRLPEQADTEENRFLVTLAAGADWHWGDKVRIGPKLYVATGNITIVQLGGAATLAF